MKSVWTCSFAALLAMVAGSAYGQTTFTLNVNGTDSFTGGEGDPWASDYNVVLDAAGSGSGAQGWSISVSADNGTINSIAPSAEVNALFSGGFKKSEVTTKGTGACAGRNGAVSAIVLSLTEPITLPGAPNSTPIAAINVSGTIPAGGGSAAILFVDGCQGAGQPVPNTITQDGATVIPTLGRKDIGLVVVANCCNKTANLGFTAANTSSATAYDGIADDGAGICSGGGGSIATEVTVGTKGATHVFANISSNAAGDGVQGWSLSVAVNGDIALDGVTTAGTVVDALFDGGFRKTEAVDPAKNGGQRGAVSGIVLSLTNPVTLPATGTASVLDFSLSAASDQGDSDIAGSLKFQNGLRGSGQPVPNTLTIGGATVEPCNLATAAVAVVFKPFVSRDNNFRRGNANDDGKLNLADPIYIINELFRQGPGYSCRASADANGDGQVDAADATFLIAYQFQGGTAPPSSNGECSSAPIEDCAEPQVCTVAP